jgi:hypothetical protein
MWSLDPKKTFDSQKNNFSREENKKFLDYLKTDFKLSDHLKYNFTINKFSIISWNCILREARKNNNSIAKNTRFGTQLSICELGFNNYINSTVRQRTVFESMLNLCVRNDISFFQEVGVHFANALKDDLLERKKDYKFEFLFQLTTPKDNGKNDYGILTVLKKHEKTENLVGKCISTGEFVIHDELNNCVYINVHIPMKNWPIPEPIFLILKKKCSYLLNELGKIEKVIFIGDFNWNVLLLKFDEIIPLSLKDCIKIHENESNFNITSNFTIGRVDGTYIVDNISKLLEFDDKELINIFYHEENNMIKYDDKIISGVFDFEDVFENNPNAFLFKKEGTKTTLLEYMFLKRLDMIINFFDNLSKEKKEKFTNICHDHYEKKIGTFNTNILLYCLIFITNITYNDLNKIIDMTTSNDKKKNINFFSARDDRDQDVETKFKWYGKKLSKEEQELIIKKIDFLKRNF